MPCQRFGAGFEADGAAFALVEGELFAADDCVAALLAACAAASAAAFASASFGGPPVMLSARLTFMSLVVRSTITSSRRSSRAAGVTLMIWNGLALPPGTVDSTLPR